MIHLSFWFSVRECLPWSAANRESSTRRVSTSGRPASVRHCVQRPARCVRPRVYTSARRRAGTRVRARTHTHTHISSSSVAIVVLQQWRAHLLSPLIGRERCQPIGGVSQLFTIVSWPIFFFITVKYGIVVSPAKTYSIINLLLLLLFIFDK